MNPFSRKAKLANEMAHQQSYSAEPYRDGMDYTDEAWAYGLRALPGSLANQLQALGEYTTGKDYPNKLGNYLNELTQVNEMGYTPQTEYEAGVAFLPELVYDPAIIAGAPYAAYKGLRNVPRLANVIADEAGRTTMRNQLGMITWQGSPHKYDGILDPTKIGTGEGAQAYGYGHYLAENQKIGQSYKNALGGGAKNLDLLLNDPVIHAQHMVNTYYGGDQAKAVEVLRRNESSRTGESLDHWKKVREIIESGEYKNHPMPEGYLYKFDLDDNAIANMLDWDAPLSEQPEAVRNALGLKEIPYSVKNYRDYVDFLSKKYSTRRFRSKATGKELDTLSQLREKSNSITDFDESVNILLKDGRGFYQKLADDKGVQGASDYLKSLGIPGIKYYDGSSRAAGEGTRNFVVFPGNENLVTPLERNGEPLGNLGAFKSQLGAVDLPMDEASRMARAREMGDIGEDLYHGTDRDFPAFGIANRGDATKAKSARAATWLVDDPSTASGYADYAAKDAQVQKLIDASYAAERRNDWDKANDLMRQAEELEQELFTNPQNGQLVMPLRAKGNFMEFDAEGATWGDLDDNTINNLIKDAKRGGYDGLKVLNLVDEAQYGVDNPATHYAVFDPKNIRSRFAKFDPAKKDSADLLASRLLPIPAGLLGLTTLDPDN